MKRFRLTTAFNTSKKKRRVIVNAGEQVFPDELFTREVMRHLGHSGQVLQLTSLARTCKRFYSDFPWRKYATRMMQYIRGWELDFFAPFAPYVEEMIWFVPCHHDWNPLNFHDCVNLKRLQLVYTECSPCDFGKNTFPPHLEILYTEPGHIKYALLDLLPIQQLIALIAIERVYVQHPLVRGFRTSVLSFPFGEETNFTSNDHEIIVDYLGDDDTRREDLVVSFL